MGVVTKYGTGSKDPTALNPIEAVFAEGVLRQINSKAAIANGDSSTSVIYFGKIPSSAILDPKSQVYAEAITGLTSFSLGFVGAPAALMSAVDIHAGGNFSAVAAVGAANYNKRAWQLAGLASDPGGLLDIIGTLGADAGAAGSITTAIAYSKSA
jgi:hypothetical protein